MPDGTFRRPPQLWEQRIAGLVAVNSVGTVSGTGTSEVGSELTPGDGGPAPEPPVIAPTPTAFGTPSTPTLTGGVQSIMVTWDGLNSSGEQYPYESAVVEIHISTTSGFTPSSSTLRGELRYPGSYTITGLSAGVTYYVRLRGRDGQGNFSAVSTQASGQTGLTTSSDYGTATIDAGAVSFNARQIGGITTTVGTTAPTSPVTGDIWLDSTGGAIVHKRWSGSSWVTQAWGSDSLSANCITATQIAAGAITAGAIAADAVTAGKISADAIDGKVITGATIRTSATAGTGTAPRAGVILDTSGLRGFDASGNQTINVNASTGAVSISGYQQAQLATISSASGSGSAITYTASGHGFSTGDVVTVTGSSNSSFNRTGTITATTSSTFTIAAAVSGSSTGGTATVAVLTGGDLGSAGSTVIDGGRITSGTITGRTVQTSSGGSRVQLSDSGVNSGDAVAFYHGGTRVGALYGSTGVVGTGIWFDGPLRSVGSNITTLGDISCRDLQATRNAEVLSALSVTGNITGSSGLSVTGSAVDMQGVYDNNTTGLAPVGITTTGRLRRNGTSTQRIKYDIATLAGELSDSVDLERRTDVVTCDPMAILDVAVVEFSVIDEGLPTERRLLGVIAEDVDDKLPIAVYREADGTPGGVNDQALVSALLAVVKQQQQTITDLTARVTALEGA